MRNQSQAICILSNLKIDAFVGKNQACTVVETPADRAKRHDVESSALGRSVSIDQRYGQRAVKDSQTSDIDLVVLRSSSQTSDLDLKYS